MKVRLLRDARINHKVGEIVEVSPTEFQFLASTGSAVLCVDEVAQAVEVPEKPKRATRKKA